MTSSSPTRDPSDTECGNSGAEPTGSPSVGKPPVGNSFGEDILLLEDIPCQRCSSENQGSPLPDPLLINTVKYWLLLQNLVLDEPKQFRKPGVTTAWVDDDDDSDESTDNENQNNATENLKDYKDLNSHIFELTPVEDLRLCASWEREDAPHQELPLVPKVHKVEEMVTEMTGTPNSGTSEIPLVFPTAGGGG